MESANTSNTKVSESRIACTTRRVLIALSVVFVMVNILDFKASQPGDRVASSALNRTRQDTMQTTRSKKEENQQLLDRQAVLRPKWNTSLRGALVGTKRGPQNIPNAATTSSVTAEDKNKVGQNVSLVTSFFADAIITLTNSTTSSSQKARHLHEITAAILKNIHNPYFAQVVVILDGTRDEVNCIHFREYLENMEKELLEWSHQHANITILHDTQMRGQSQQKLTCVNREQGQPNYYEMFQYATNSNTTSPIVTSPIVVLENADHVFDETLIWAGLIKPNAVLTLSSHGYNKNLTPPEVTAYFQFANRNLSKPLDWDTLHQKIVSRCNIRSNSWDGYIFHQDYVRGTLDATAFRRPTNINTTAFFNMNESGGENAALWALLKNLPDDTYSAHGCFFVKSWHYHAAPKMHTYHETRGFGWTPILKRVPGPKIRWTCPRNGRPPTQPDKTVSADLLIWVEKVSPAISSGSIQGFEACRPQVVTTNYGKDRFTSLWSGA